MELSRHEVCKLVRGLQPEHEPVIVPYEIPPGQSALRFYAYVQKVKGWVAREVQHMRVEQQLRWKRQVPASEELVIRVEVREGRCLLYRLRPFDVAGEPPAPAPIPQLKMEKPTANTPANAAVQQAIREAKAERERKMRGEV